MSPKSSHVLSLDQGTTSSRAIVFAEDASARGADQRPTSQHYPHPGWVQQDPGQIWESTLASARGAIAMAGITGADIAAIGIANQRETLVVWDRQSGVPIHPAIVWQSRQSQPQVDALLARGLSPLFQQKTGLIPDAYFTATKLAWLLEERPDLRARAEAGELLAGTVDSWLIWNLTRGAAHVTDVTNASRTMLFDIHQLAWSPRLLSALSIPPQILPAVRPSAGFIASTDPEIFSTEIPIAGVAGDQQAALFGQTCFVPGSAKNTYGTGSFLLMNTGGQAKSSTHKLLSTVAWQIASGTDYALEGAVFVSGAAVDWLREGLGIIADAADVESLAASVPDTGGVTFVPALTGLGAPHWDPTARGAILGVTRGTTAAHIARATLEAIAMQTRDLVEAMRADSGIALTSLRVDGGAARNNLLLQMQADLLGVPVVRPKNVETTALGAAFLAGLGCGFWPSLDALANRWQIDRAFEPSSNASGLEERYAVWQRAIERSRGWTT